jgi:hypothetical protein
MKQTRINKIIIVNNNNNNNNNKYINILKTSIFKQNIRIKTYLKAKKERPLDDLPLELCDENAEQVMNEVRSELGTIFGYDPASQAVGISGKIELIEIDGPTIKVALNGRFWHATDTVMLRVKSFIQNRIPEVIDVILDIDKSNIIDDNRLGNNKLY